MANDILSQLHGLLGEDMLNRVQEAVDKREPLSPSEWSAIAKFLKDNGIDSVPNEDSPQAKIARVLDLPSDDDDSHIAH